MQIDEDFFLELGEFYSALMASLIKYLIQYKIRLQTFSLNFLKQNKNVFWAFSPVWVGFGTSESRGLQ